MVSPDTKVARATPAGKAQYSLLLQTPITYKDILLVVGGPLLIWAAMCGQGPRNARLSAASVK
jgi:hypothetical protein